MSPWNFAIFYVDPLEIHPGPAFTVTGWVHTNSDLYTGHNSLTFADKVTYGSDWSVGFNPLDGTHDTDAPAAPNYPGNLPPARDLAMQPFGLDSTSIFNTTDANPNNDSYRELIEQPTAGYTDPLAGQRYYDQAAIQVSIDASNNVTIRKLNGATVSAASAAGSNDLKLYNCHYQRAYYEPIDLERPRKRDGPPNDSRCWQNRDQPEQQHGQQRPHRQLSVEWHHVHNRYERRLCRVPWNSIEKWTDPAGQWFYRRKRQSRVYPGGLQHRHRDCAVELTGTNNDPTRPQASDASGNPLYTRAPSSVAADAVTILSNNWNDSNGDNSGNPLSGRVATNTTVNTAIICWYRSVRRPASQRRLSAGSLLQRRGGEFPAFS